MICVFETIWYYLMYFVGLFMAVGIIGAFVSGFSDAFRKHGTLETLITFSILMLLLIGGLCLGGGHGRFSADY